MRNPSDRYYAAFKNYGHYAKHYGRGVEGFEAFVDEQVRELAPLVPVNAPLVPVNAPLLYR